MLNYHHLSQTSLNKLFLDFHLSFIESISIEEQKAFTKEMIILLKNHHVHPFLYEYKDNNIKSPICFAPFLLKLYYLSFLGDENAQDIMTIFYQQRLEDDQKIGDCMELRIPMSLFYGKSHSYYEKHLSPHLDNDKLYQSFKDLLENIKSYCQTASEDSIGSIKKLALLKKSYQDIQLKFPIVFEKKMSQHLFAQHFQKMHPNTLLEESAYMSLMTNLQEDIFFHLFFSFLKHPEDHAVFNSIDIFFNFIDWNHTNSLSYLYHFEQQHIDALIQYKSHYRYHSFILNEILGSDVNKTSLNKEDYCLIENQLSIEDKIFYTQNENLYTQWEFQSSFHQLFDNKIDMTSLFHSIERKDLRDFLENISLRESFKPIINQLEQYYLNTILKKELVYHHQEDKVNKI